MNLGMNLMLPTEYKERTESVPPFEIHVVSYRLENQYFCSVDNVNPGAVIARAQGRTREAVEAVAVARAKEKLRRTRFQASRAEQTRRIKWCVVQYRRSG
jgi:hypothetical protein